VPRDAEKQAIAKLCEGASHFCKKHFFFECERPRSRIVQYASGDARTINTKLRCSPLRLVCVRGCNYTSMLIHFSCWAVRC